MLAEREHARGYLGYGIQILNDFMSVPMPFPNFQIHVFGRRWYRTVDYRHRIEKIL